VEDILASYPQLSRDHVQAAQAYAAAYLSLDKTIWESDPVTK